MKWPLIIQAVKQAAIWLIHRFQKTEHEKRQEKYDKAMEDTKCWFRDHFQSDRLSDSDTRDRDTGSDASKPIIETECHPTDEQGICLDQHNLRLLNRYILELEEGYP